MASALNDASCANAPLTPVVEVSPAHATIGDNITLTVKIQVNKESNVYASNLVVNGVGDVFLISKQDSIIVKPEETGTLEWLFNATKLGSVHFSFGLSVINSSDQSVTLSASLTSKEIGISKGSATFVLGLAFLTIFVLLSSRYSDRKENQSLLKLSGGELGLFISFPISLIIGALWGWLVTDFLRLPQMLSLALFGSIWIVLGLSFCQASKDFLKSKVGGVEKISGQLERIVSATVGGNWKTELGGLLFVIFGLAGFFIIFDSYFEAVLLISIGFLGIGKEYIEMETKEN